MELFFLCVLILTMIIALTSGFPVAFALPGSAILTISLAALCGYLFAGDSSAYFAEGGPWQWLNAGVTNFRSIYWNVERDTLIAIPLFIFMGIMLQRSKIAEDLLVSMARLFGPVPGGLGISVIIVGALLAATTGIVGATVIAMGMISLPAMLKNNYSKSLATGTICASGTLGQIIPPSIVLIILADQLSSAADQASTIRKAAYRTATGEFSMPSSLDITSASAGDMFMGAIIPGMILVSLYIVYILAVALLKPGSAPPVGQNDKYDKTFIITMLWSLIPPLMLIFAVLGSILLGVATVNQAGAIGAVGAIFMGSYRLHRGERFRFLPALIGLISTIVILGLLSVWQLNIKSIQSDAEAMGLVLAAIAVSTMIVALIWAIVRIHRVDNTLHEVMTATVKTTSMVFIILIGAAMLTSSFRAFGGEELVKHFLTSMPGGFWTQFIVVMVVIFILGFFLDFIEIAVVVVPIVAPILLSATDANVTAVWLGVMIGINMQTSFLTPPFGFALFYLRGVASAAVKTLDIYKGVIPFISLQLLTLLIVGLVPPLVNYLPNRTFLTSENAPPPMNPRLQSCIDEQQIRSYLAPDNSLFTEVERMENLDMTFLPENYRDDLIQSYEAIKKITTLVTNIKEAELALKTYETEYASLHHQVRDIQSAQQRATTRIEQLKQDIKRIQGENQPEMTQVNQLKSQITDAEQEIDRLQKLIPDDWSERHEKFIDLTKSHTQAVNRYHNNSDTAYETISKIAKTLQQYDEYETLKTDLLGLKEVIGREDPDSAITQIQKTENAVASIEGTSRIKSALYKARKALKSEIPDRDKGQEQLNHALELYQQQFPWREAGYKQLSPALNAFELALRQNVGLRQQPKLETAMAKKIAVCLSSHKNISLSF
ncbi:TRAP transporter large permease [Gynuella sunshinyii]|uniref:TRAP-type mannitol/chloroaromatic compound transport system, large permease component n=1 Tax=Gynuella sunshinyii YC6258 TaxID=1445510 RepID=A0A0C5VMU7_9GAMM|nr:TRAP transporter large permease subunit [Gynuella sunshinyii]AJQ94658.1 TRAP-type mannitol/chloroaromatic compound transport system, large permease component [Gynuella sunshinyii YC6258]